MTTITAAAYIVADDNSIAGLGDTAAAAVADAREWTRGGVEVHDSRREWQDAGQSGAYIARCTAALAEQVRREGGCIAWDFIDGVACVVDEDEAGADSHESVDAAIAAARAEIPDDSRTARAIDRGDSWEDIATFARAEGFVELSDLLDEASEGWQS